MNWLMKIISAALPEPAQPLKDTALRESYGATIDDDEDQWRKLTGDASRDLTPMTQARMQKVACYLWEQNLLGNRLVELPTAFLLAEGVTLTVDDEENQKALDRFWFDPINDMDLKLPKKARELSIFGEQCYPAFTNEHSGMVRIGYLDPALIETAVMDPDNPEQPIGVVTVKDKKGNARRYRVIINGPESVFTRRTQEIRAGFADGDAFYFRINDLSSGRRGRSDLLAPADWLDAYDQFLFGEVDRYNFLRSFIWDVTLKNATPEQVEARAKKITAPKPGSVRVHNDSEEWEAVTPDLQATDTSQGARLLRNHVLGGASFPEHWFGGGGDVNRAAAAEMEAPTLKMYTMRQKVLKHMLESIGRYVLMRNAQKDNATNEIDWSDPKWRPTATFPELSEKDLTKQAAALAQVAVACASLLASNLITRLFALKIIAVIAGKLGVDADADELLTDAAAEASVKSQNDGFTTPPAGAAPGGALQEAVDLIAGFQAATEQRFTELQRAADAAREPAGPDAADRFAEALAGTIEAQGKHTKDVVDALAAHSTRVDLELTLKHGKTKKTVTLGDGRKVEMTEEDAQ